MAKNIAKNRRQREEACRVLVETAKAYLATNSDDGVLEPEEKARIENAIRVLG